ncbi:MAG: NAD-dependent epimerase/dehydratase family protein [Promethearchaeota archaeon]
MGGDHKEMGISKGKKILITGGLGFIGSHAAENFSAQGFEVICVDNLSRSGPNYIPTNQPGKSDQTLPSSTSSVIFQYFRTQLPNIKIHIMDLRNAEKISQIIQKEKPDYILHAAGQTSAHDSIQEPMFDFENNVLGLVNTLNAARMCSPAPKFIYLSTNKVYGTKINSITLQETNTRYTLQDPPNGIAESFGVDLCGHTPYGTSKLTGDLYVQEFGATYGIPIIIFRMSCIYGPRQFGLEGQGWISHFVIRALKQKLIEIFGTGKQVRDILHISDLLKLFDKAILYLENTPVQNDPSENVFNIGGGPQNTLSLIELLHILESELNFSILTETHPTRMGDQQLYISDISRAVKIFDWQPQISPREGIASVIEWTQNNISLF